MGQVARRENEIEVRDKRGRVWGVQCTANRRDGERCRRWAIKGGYVCLKHGGNLPVVRRAANARLRALRDAALIAIEESLIAKDEAVRFRAAKYVMTLSGITSTAEKQGRGRPAKALPAAQTTDVDAEIEALIAGMGAGAPALPSGDDQEPAN